LTSKNGAQPFAEIRMKTCFARHINTIGNFVDKTEVAQKLFGKVWKIREKILDTHKIMPAPTPSD